MTVKNAIKIVDWLLNENTNLAQGLVDLTKPWNADFDCMNELAKSVAGLLQREVDALEKIKKQLVVKCSHPKRYRDIDPEGNLYCIGCNMDL